MVDIKYNKKIINGRYHWTFTEGTVGGETWEFMDRLSKKQFLQAVERQKQSRRNLALQNSQHYRGD
jgi:hypothetical protein